MKGEDKHNWLEAMKEEMTSMEKNQTWILVDKPKEQKTVGRILISIGGLSL